MEVSRLETSNVDRGIYIAFLREKFLIDMNIYWIKIRRMKMKLFLLPNIFPIL